MTEDEELELLELKRRRAQAAARASTEHAPEVGVGETFWNSASDAIPAGRPIVDATTTGVMQLLRRAGGVGQANVNLTPQAQAEMERLGKNMENPAVTGPMENIAAPETKGLVDEYRGVRDMRAKRIAAGTAQNSGASTLGTGLGIGLSLLAPLPKVGIGGAQATAGQRILSNTLTGGGYGALQGAVNSKGDLTKGEVGQVLKGAVGIEGLQRARAAMGRGQYLNAALETMGSGALGGGGMGAALGSGIEAARATGALQKGQEALKDFGIRKGRTVLTNGADQLSTRNAVPEAAVEEAIRSGAIRPLGNNPGTLTRLEELTETVGNQYGNIVRGLEAKGVKGPEAREIAKQLMAKADELRPNTMDEALPRLYERESRKLLTKAEPYTFDDAGRVTQEGGKLKLTQAENLKRSLQKQAKYGSYEETTKNEVRKDIASVVRQANEDAIAGAAVKDPTLAPLADEFQPVKQRLGRLLEAEGAATRGAARGAQRTSQGAMDGKAMLGAAAAGHPEIIAGGLVKDFAKARMPSTLAWGGLKMSDLLGDHSPGAPAAALQAIVNGFRRKDDAEKAALIEALRNSP